MNAHDTHTARERGSELGALLRLAWPVVAAEIGWVTMWLVDSMMVGPLGAEALGAVALGGSLCFVFAIAGLGMLLGLDFLVAHAFGTGDLRRAHAALVQGGYLALVLGVVLTAILLAAVPALPLLGADPTVVTLAEPYMRASAWSLAPLLLFTALRRYLQAMGIVQPIMVTLLAANVVNAVADWALVYGHLGAPVLGVAGAGWATCFSRTFMLLGLLGYTLWRERRRASGLAAVPLRPDPVLARQLVRLGVPAATQLLLEVGSFTIVTALAARLAPAALAAHHVAISVASFTFMVPLGLSSAAAVAVGQALGRGHGAAARRAGWTALALGAGFMLAAAVAFVLGAEAIVRLFTSVPEVVATGVTLLYVAAVFQLSDGIQVVTTGALRGTGDTRTPLLANLVGHWLLSLPLGAVLCFRFGAGVVGLWIGLAAGLSAVATVLLWVWRRHARRLGGDARGPRLRESAPGGSVPAGRGAAPTDLRVA